MQSEIELENEGVMTPVREGEERVDEGEGGSGSVTKCIVLESEWGHEGEYREFMRQHEREEKIW